ncbi:MAG: efflux RND transporter periplasmic adaptor subunit [Pseudomonadota bacterium]
MSDTQTTDTTAEAPNGKRRRILTILIAIFIVVGIGWLLFSILVLSKREKTDDAYVVGNQVRISAQTPGTVVEVLARNTSRVAAGQVLLRLDTTDAKQAVDRAEAALAQSVRQVRQRQAETHQYDALVSARTLELQHAQTDLERRLPLLAEKAVSEEEVRHARDAVAMARAQLDQARELRASSNALVDSTTVLDNPAVQQQRALYKDAWIDLQRAAVVAPMNGYIAQRSVQLGQHVLPGEHLMSVIPLQDVWLEANFKENQLRNLRIGQPATITSDLYGGSVAFHGHVIGLQAGTGAAFSVLPPQNASGNWIKVVQRVAVKIVLDPKELAEHPLRIGLSMTVKVDTHDRSGLVLAGEPVTDVQEATTAYTTDIAAADAAAAAIIQHNSGRQ